MEIEYKITGKIGKEEIKPIIIREVVITDPDGKEMLADYMIVYPRVIMMNKLCPERVKDGVMYECLSEQCAAFVSFPTRPLLLNAEKQFKERTQPYCLKFNNAIGEPIIVVDEQ